MACIQGLRRGHRAWPRDRPLKVQRSLGVMPLSFFFGHVPSLPSLPPTGSDPKDPSHVRSIPCLISMSEPASGRSQPNAIWAKGRAPPSWCQRWRRPLPLGSPAPSLLPSPHTTLALYALHRHATQAVPFKVSLMFISRHFYLYANVLVVVGPPEQKVPHF